MEESLELLLALSGRHPDLFRGLAILAFMGLASLIAATLVLGAWLMRLARNGSRGRELRDSAPQVDATLEGLEARLSEMTRRINERNDYINSIFASLDEGILVVDPLGGILLYNPRAAELLGIGPSVFFPPAQEPAEGERTHMMPFRLARALEACSRMGSEGGAERIELHDQERILELRILPILSKYRGRAFFGHLVLAKDITEIRKLEGLKKDFVATVSHEFRTPLTLISGFMEMFKTQTDMAPEDRARAFEIMEIETERLSRLVSELLTLSEIENALPEARREMFDPVPTLERIGMTFGAMAARRGQRLELSVEAVGLSIRGNEAWFHRAVSNLVENALKYSPPGGLISLKAEPHATGTPETQLHVRVADQGPGIPSGEREKIFERFYRVEKSRGSGSGGSGLGLAIVKDIVSVLGGRVELESGFGQGSIFHLWIPVEKTQKHEDGPLFQA